MTRYESLAAELAGQIESGILRPGERLPSTRTLAKSRGVSLATVNQALSLLEDRGLASARPRSGYYVNAHWKAAASVPAVSQPPSTAGELAVSELVFEVLGEIRKRHVVPLGSAFPSPLLFPLDKLGLALGKSARRLDPWKTVEDLSPGSAELRRQVAKRYSAHGVGVAPDEIVVTSGALEALNLCLQAVARPGDVVAIESPCFYAALQSVERLGLRAVEVATDPVEGMDLAALERAIRRHKVKAVWTMPTFQNPLGATMPEAKKRALVALVTCLEVPLIEDDVYAELHFGRERPRPAKAFDRAGWVMHCGSFSKSLAPGYRVGWCAPGRFARAIERGKLMTSIATSIPVQEALADFLRHGGYDHHLRALRTALKSQHARALEAIRAHFPQGTRHTRPDGGYFTWVELPEGSDAMEIYRAGLKRGISVAPGPIFSAKRAFGRCLRLNTGHPWSEAMAAAYRTLGRAARG